MAGAVPTDLLAKVLLEEKMEIIRNSQSVLQLPSNYAMFGYSKLFFSFFLKRFFTTEYHAEFFLWLFLLSKTIVFLK